MGVSVLIASVCDEVDVLLALGYVRSKNFPVVTTVFKSDLALQGLDEMLANLGRASEEGHLGISLLENLLHDRAIGVDKVHVFLGETAVVHHANPLLEHNRCARVTLDKRLVTHIECAHHLKARNLDREVEGGDHTDGTVGPSVGGVELTGVIAWLSDGVGEESDTITAEVLVEVNSDGELSSRLRVTFGSHSLDGLDEELEDFGVVHALDNLAVDLGEHQVSLLVLEGVMKAGLGALHKTLNEGLDFINLSVRDLEHGAALKRVDEIDVLGGWNPVASDQVVALIRATTHSVRVDGRKSLQVLRDSAHLRAHGVYGEGSSAE